MVKKRVVVTDPRFDGFQAEQEAAYRFGAEFEIFACQSASDMDKALQGVDVALVNLVPVGETALAGMRPGGLIIRYGIGYDNVDVQAAHRLGVRVANIPDYGSDTVADHAASCMVALLRRLLAYTDTIRHDGWTSPNVVGPLPAFASTTVGLVGVGRIGLLVARRLQAFGIRILAADPYADRSRLATMAIDLVSFEAMLGQVHGISLHLPATPATRHIINRNTLAALRSGSVLVNTARGALIDEEALADALASGQLAGAALDVFDPEPLSVGSRLRALANVILTPHAGFYSQDSQMMLQRMAAEETARALAGEPLRSIVT